MFIRSYCCYSNMKLFFGLVLASSFATRETIGLHRIQRDANPAGIVFGLTERATEKVLEIPVDADEDEYAKITRTRATQSDKGISTLTKLPQSANLNDFNFNFATDVNSVNDAKLELAPGSILSAVPGQLVNVVFLLINRGGDKYFYINVNERQGPNSGPDQIKFPSQQQSQFINGLNDPKPYLRRNETKNIVISLRVPQNAPIGTNLTFTLEAQPDGSGNSNTLIRRFYFNVEAQQGSFNDRSQPRCSLIEDTRSVQCTGVLNDPLNCRQKRWGGKFEFVDYESGLRSLTGREMFDYQTNDIYYSHSNFIIGSKLPASYSFLTTCCVNAYSVAGFDVAGNEILCTAGEGATVQFGSLQIAVTVVVIVLALVIVIGIIVFCVMRKKRNAELAEMRASPQAR